MFVPANTAHFTLLIPSVRNDFKVLAFNGTEAISCLYASRTQQHHGAGKPGDQGRFAGQACTLGKRGNLKPQLLVSNDFCALNLYQLALMSTLSYSDFGQQPVSHPEETDSVSFPLQPSIGNWFGDTLPKFDELWQVDATQAGGKAYYPLYEEAPYSKRLEVVPFDPVL